MCWSEFKLKEICHHPHHFHRIASIPIHHLLLNDCLLQNPSYCCSPPWKWSISIVLRTIMKMKYFDSSSNYWREGIHLVQPSCQINFLSYAFTHVQIDRMGRILLSVWLLLLPALSRHIPFPLEFTSDEVSLYQVAREEKRECIERRKRGMKRNTIQETST